MSEQNQLSQDWVAGQEGGDRHLQGCDYQIEHQPSHSGGVFERNIIGCVQCENGKSISPIDSAQPTTAHDADTYSECQSQARRRPCCGAPGFL